MFALLIALTIAPAPAGDASATAKPGIAPGQIAPGQVAPPPVKFVAGHRLTQQADGSWLYFDRARGFEARILPDGQLSFSGIQYPSEGNNQAWSTRDRDPYVDWRNNNTVRGINPGSADVGGAIGAIVSGLAWGAIEKSGKKRGTKAPAANQPLDARKSFSLATADFRAQLATQWYTERLENSFDELDADLRALWSDAIAPKTRRAAIFAIWDGFDQRLPSPPLHPPPEVRRELDELRKEAAARGREAIYEFVRTYLPRTTREGYGRIELRRLNERRTQLDPFDPYGLELESRARAK